MPEVPPLQGPGARGGTPTVKAPRPATGLGSPPAAALGRRSGGEGAPLCGWAWEAPPGAAYLAGVPARRRPGVQLCSPPAPAGPVRRRGGEADALASVPHSMNALSLEDLISKYLGEQRGQFCPKFQSLCCVARKNKTKQNLLFLSLSFLFP